MTPLKSDQLEVKKILGEALGRALEAGGVTNTVSYRDSRLSRAIYPPLKSAELQRAVDAGKDYCRGLGFHPGTGEMYESDFILESATGFDFIEHIVRDRMGIYDGPHGKHIEDARAWTFAAYNVIREERIRNEAPSVLAEFPFSKPSSLRYDAFRSALDRLLEGLKDPPAVTQLGLWQRKLGLGPGREFLLRLECSDFEGAAGSGLRVLPLLHEIVASSDASTSQTIMIIMKEILSPL